MQVKDFTEINPSPSSPIEKRLFIDYIDTAAVTEGRLGDIQHLIGSFPSRAQREVHANDILISSVRPNLRHNYFVTQGEDGMIASSGFVHIRVKKSEKVVPRFLYYFLTSPSKIRYYTRIADCSQSAYPSFNKDVIEDIEFPFISKPTQLRIAGILGSLDEKIEVNRRKIAELEALAKTIYDYWFVQFDFPDADGRPYKSSGGTMEWKQELKREIPKGWGDGNLYDIAFFENGLACQKHRPRKGEQALPVIKIREMHEGISEDTESVSINIPEKNRIEDGDLLFSWSASLETMIWCGGKAGLNQHIFKVIPKGKYPMEYVYQQLSQYIINFVKMAEARKTTMGHITTDHLKQSQIILPDEAILSEFSDVTAPIASQRIVLQQEVRELTKQRDMLLPLLMNGQVEVK